MVRKAPHAAESGVAREIVRTSADPAEWHDSHAPVSLFRRAVGAPVVFPVGDVDGELNVAMWFAVGTNRTQVAWSDTMDIADWIKVAASICDFAKNTSSHMVSNGELKIDHVRATEIRKVLADLNARVAELDAHITKLFMRAK